MASNQAKLAISSVKTGIWFTYPTIPNVLAGGLFLTNALIHEPRCIVWCASIVLVYSILPTLLSYYIGAFIGKIFLQQQNKLIAVLSGPVVAVLAGIAWIVCNRIYMSTGIPWKAMETMGNTDGAAIGIAMAQMLFVCAFLIYAVCEIIIGVLLTFCKKLIIEKT